MASARHSVRFKGVTLGAFTVAEIADKLRAGELSLSHAVERSGHWVTVRQLLQQTQAATAAPGASPSLLDRLAGKASTSSGDTPPPPPGSNPVAESIESRVRAGYLWCGLTFVLPLAIGLPAGALTAWLSDRSVALRSTLTLAALAGSAYAAWRAHRGAMDLVEEGLDDIGRSMQQLGVALAAASALFWIAVTWLWVAR